MTTDKQRAMAHLADAIDAHDQLTAAHAFKPRDFDLIGRLKSAERFHLGVAQVYATLAVADAPRTEVHHHHDGPPIVTARVLANEVG